MDKEKGRSMQAPSQMQLPVSPPVPPPPPQIPPLSGHPLSAMPVLPPGGVGLPPGCTYRSPSHLPAVKRTKRSTQREKAHKQLLEEGLAETGLVSHIYRDNVEALPPGHNKWEKKIELGDGDLVIFKYPDGHPLQWILHLRRGRVVTRVDAGFRVSVISGPACNLVMRCVDRENMCLFGSESVRSERVGKRVLRLLSSSGSEPEQRDDVGPTNYDCPAPEDGTCLLLGLPIELLIYITTFFDLPTMLSMALTSQEFRHILLSDEHQRAVWYPQCKKHGILHPSVSGDWTAALRMNIRAGSKSKKCAECNTWIPTGEHHLHGKGLCYDCQRCKRVFPLFHRLHCVRCRACHRKYNRLESAVHSQCLSRPKEVNMNYGRHVPDDDAEEQFPLFFAELRRIEEERIARHESRYKLG